MKNKKNRKEFIRSAALITFGSVLLNEVVYGIHLPEDLLITSINAPGLKAMNKSSALIVLNDRPWNIETPAHLLDDSITPADKFFVRNNGIPPSNIDISTWKLEIAGESVLKPTSFSIQELKTKFKQYTYQLTLECGGNGRAEFDPPTAGAQWNVGAVGCAQWTGVRLRDVLEYAGIKPDAVYIGYYGKDVHLSSDPKKVVISRGVPMKKALENESLIAWEMNGKPIPLQHGYPLRLVFGGWPASASGKWLHKIVIRNKIHDGPKMEGQSYRVPCTPIEPGAPVKDENMCIIESMPVKSIITSPKSGAIISGNNSFEVRGHAWAGDFKVVKMHVSIDFGNTWQSCLVEPPINRLAWQRWRCRVSLPKKGYYELWAKATDEKGNQQPVVVPGWNPKGYLNNACHRIAVKST